MLTFVLKNKTFFPNIFGAGKDILIWSMYSYIRSLGVGIDILPVGIDINRWCCVWAQGLIMARNKHQHEDKGTLFI